MKVEGIATKDEASGEFVINEFQLAKVTTPQLTTLVKTIVGRLPIEYFAVDKTKGWITIDVFFAETALSILYDLETGNVSHEQMGLTTIKRFITEGIVRYEGGELSQ